MNLKKLVLIVCFALLSPSISADIHRHVRAEETAGKEALRAGFCEVKIINESYDDVSIGGMFEDGAPLTPFNLYASSSPAYISLYFSGYCHSSIFLDIRTFSGQPVFYDYAYANSIVRIVTGAMKQATAKARLK